MIIPTDDEYKPIRILFFLYRAIAKTRWKTNSYPSQVTSIRVVILKLMVMMRARLDWNSYPGSIRYSHIQIELTWYMFIIYGHWSRYNFSGNNISADISEDTISNE